MTGGRFFSYLNTASEIIGAYNGKSPFAEFIRAWFRSYKKAGSRDRRIIAALCYGYFRMGRSLTEVPMHEKMLSGYFLCNTSDDGMIETLRPNWLSLMNSSFNSKINQIKTVFPSFSIEQIFPCIENMSDGLDAKAFVLSLLRQPDIFVRIRPGHFNSIERKLKRAGIPWQVHSESTISFAPNVDIGKIADLHSEIVIQDFSSQKTAELLPPAESLNEQIRIWDCCAGGGGKSIMAYDFYQKPELTVTDNRQSALERLRERFYASGIHDFRMAAADVSDKLQTAIFPEKYYDLVIADVPCSGSGTWGRTPERMSFVSKEEIHSYSDLQYRIAGNVIPHIVQGKYLLYITCSVYQEENEAVVERICKNYPMRLVKKQLITGNSNAADTLFAALLISES